MPGAATPSASSDQRAWVVPEALRPELALRYGPVLSGPEATSRLRQLGLFAACGDRVTADALLAGAVPLVAIVDYKTRRSEPVDRAVFAPLARRRTVRVGNPPGMLTGALRSAVRELVASGGGLIEVDGEEDLGSLALVESLPAGATVIYGIPGEGVSFVTVDAAAKEQVRQFIARMQPTRLDRGPEDR
jgi:GTP-dependent dephospho-CoA kinase